MLSFPLELPPGQELCLATDGALWPSWPHRLSFNSALPTDRLSFSWATVGNGYDQSKMIYLFRCLINTILLTELLLHTEDLQSRRQRRCITKGSFLINTHTAGIFFQRPLFLPPSSFGSGNSVSRQKASNLGSILCSALSICPCVYNMNID